MELKGYINFQGLVNPRSAQNLLSHVHEYIRMGVKTIDIGIYSYGGDSDSGIYLYHQIKNLQQYTSINTINLSKCDSSAIPIYLSGNKKYAFKNSEFTIHQGRSNLNGSYTITDLKIQMQRLDAINKAYIDVVSKYFSLDIEKYFEETVITISDIIPKVVDEVIDKISEDYKYHCYMTSKDDNNLFVDKNY